MKIGNFQSQVCVCAASTDFTGIKSRAEMREKMIVKNLVKKAWAAVLTLAICMPMFWTVMSVNAAEAVGKYVDVKIRFLNADGEEITEAKAGDKVTVKVTATPMQEDGCTPLEAEVDYTVNVYGFVEGMQELTPDNSETTVTVPDKSFKNPFCMFNGGVNSTISGNTVSFEDYRGDVDNTELSVELSDYVDHGDSSNSGSSSSSSSSSSGSSAAESIAAATASMAIPTGNRAGASTIGGINVATSMNSFAVTTPAASVAASVGLSEADVAAGTNVRFYICNSLDREMKDALKSAAEASGKKVVSYITADMYTITKAGVVTKIRNAAAPVTMTFGLPGSLAKTGNSYSVMCLNSDGKSVVFEDADTNNATLTINATAFGTYAVVVNP